MTGDLFDQLVEEAGLANEPRLQPDPGSFDLDGELARTAARPAALVRRTSITALVRLPRPEALAWFVLLTGSFFAVAVWLALDANYVFGDTLSRAASATFTVQSRDPHLAAVGFVFPPLMTVLQIPFVGLRDLWPAFVDHGIVGAVVSATATALAAVEVMRIIREQTGRVGRARLAGVAFALNPMTILYAANGMSEALWTYLALRAARALMAWIRDDEVSGLVVCGFALGVGYLVRSEAVIAAAGAMWLVAAIDVARMRHKPKQVIFAQVGMDATTLLLPVALTFIGWSLASWLITGEPFAQFSSAYGNSSIIAAESAGAAKPALLPEALQSLGWTALMAPVLPLCLIWGALTMRRRADVALLGVLVPLGLVLVFEIYSTASGSTFQFFRYFILAVPLGVIGAAVLFRRVGTVLCFLALAVAPVTTWLGMSDGNVGVQEHYVRAALFPSTATAEEQEMLRRYATERRIARSLDAMHLSEGRVLVDVIFGHPIVVASKHPKQFVITTDRDFTQALDRPWESGVRYLLTVPDDGRGRSDAVNRRYPGIYETGAGVASLVWQADPDGPDPPFRLYRVLRPSERVNGDRARAPRG